MCLGMMERHSNPAGTRISIRTGSGCALKPGYEEQAVTANRYVLGSLNQLGKTISKLVTKPG